MAEAVQRKWKKIAQTDEMISNLMQGKLAEKELTKKDHPSCYRDERKVGYMELMKQLWEVKGYECLGLSTQNLRNKAAYAEKRPGSVRETNDIFFKGKAY